MNRGAGPAGNAHRGPEPAVQPGVEPATRLAVTLVTSLVLWLPSALACLRGSIDLPAAGLRYLAALVVARLVIGALAYLVSSYRASAGAADADPPRRRKEDHAPAHGE